MFGLRKSSIKRVILISIDNLRYDCIGYQPDKKELHRYNVESLLQTPTLDKLAEKAVCFTQCISTNTYTTSAHASLFTGLYPPHHGVRAFFDTKLSRNVKTLAEIFKENGYTTIFATDVKALFEPLELTRGFDYIFERDDNSLLKLLDKMKKEKIFLFVHFFDVHEPYLFCETPTTDDYNKDYFYLMENIYKRYGMEIKDRKPHSLWNNFVNKIERNIEDLFPLYVKGVTKFDKGRFNIFISNMANIGFINDSLITIFSDHGEGKCEHQNPKIFSHGADPYDNVLRVPLIVLHPDLKPEIKYEIISIIDIFSIITKLTKLKVSPEYDIDSLWPDNLRKFTYSENWIAFKGGSLEEDNEGKPVIPHLNISDNLWLLRHRVIRTLNKKFLIRGKQEDVFDYASYISEEEFVKSLYRKLLVRWEDESGLEYHADSLLRKLTTREEKIEEFLSSEEYNLIPKFFYYDLKTDPYEENPIPPTRSILMLNKFTEIVNKILDIEKGTVKTEKIFNNGIKTQNEDEQKEKIMKQLKDLGYF